MLNTKFRTKFRTKLRKKLKIELRVESDTESRAKPGQSGNWLSPAILITLLLVLLLGGADSLWAQESTTEAFGANDVSSVTRFLGGLHPLSVHFPLALIFAAFLFELIFVVSSNSKWRTSAFHTLTLGALISMATISLGLMASEVGPFLGPDAELVANHRLLGLLTSALSLIALYALAQSQMKKTPKSKAKTLTLAYRITLTLATVSVFIAGHFGSELAGL